MNYLHPALQWFNALPAKRKRNLSVFIILIILLCLLLSWWTLTPTYAVLFNHLEEQDANRILSQLEEADIPYQIHNGGRDILIDKNLIAKTRLKIMSTGMQFTGSAGFELFDKSDFGMTDFSQKINYQRALQGELERTIASLEEIQQARVHLVIPENHLFNQEDNQPKAAVTLYLKRTLTSRQVQSIQRLITASVAHLLMKNVVVVDNKGNTLSLNEKENDSSHLTTKKTIEHYLNDKVMQMLHKIYKDDQFMVKIDASINYDEIQRELITPQTQGLITHEKEVKHSSAGKNEKDKTNQELSIEKSYRFGSEKELFKRARGTIERLSISVVVPKKTSMKTIAQVERLVKSIVGFNKQRGDFISVEPLISSQPASIIPSVPSVPTSHSQRDVEWLGVIKTKPSIAFLITLFIVSGASGTLYIQRCRKKRRQLLLIELTRWLNHHE